MTKITKSHHLRVRSLIRELYRKKNNGIKRAEGNSLKAVWVAKWSVRLQALCKSFSKPAKQAIQACRMQGQRDFNMTTYFIFQDLFKSVGCHRPLVGLECLIGLCSSLVLFGFRPPDVYRCINFICTHFVYFCIATFNKRLAKRSLKYSCFVPQY